jgi:hypothetical protein
MLSGAFNKNGKSSTVKGAVMLKLSPFRKTVVAPVLVRLAENVSICPRIPFSNDEVKLMVIGPANALVEKSARSESAQSIGLLDMFAPLSDPS